MFDPLLAFEHKNEPIASRKRFLYRFGRNLASAAILIAISLAGGIGGYMVTEHYSLLDAYLSAAMILSGMGPVGEVHTTAGKLFAGSYALYSGLVLVVSASLILAPLLHRFLHYLHVDYSTDEPQGPSGSRQEP
jgi:hypothetical protein